MKLLLLGLDGAGKTVVLEQLKTLYKTGGVDVEKIPPTVGLNLGNLTCNGFAVTLWDLGGGCVRAFIHVCGTLGIFFGNFFIWTWFFRSFVPGHENLRQIWPQYYAEADAVVFVIDSSDTLRLTEVRKEVRDSQQFCHSLRIHRAIRLPAVLQAWRMFAVGAVRVLRWMCVALVFL